jgi:hypothetical protein
MITHAAEVPLIHTYRAKNGHTCGWTIIASSATECEGCLNITRSIGSLRDAGMTGSVLTLCRLATPSKGPRGTPHACVCPKSKTDRMYTHDGVDSRLLKLVMDEELSDATKHCVCVKVSGSECKLKGHVCK